MKNIDLDYLDKKYPWKHLPTHQMPTWPCEARRNFGWFERYTRKNISQISILDLGCGNGNFMCIMNELGAKSTYGIELDLEYAKKAKQLLGANDFLQNVSVGNYYDSEFMENLIFSDNTKLQDIDLFHLNAYEGKLNNKQKVLDNCFLKFAKKGAFLLMHPGLVKEKSFYNSRNLNLIFQADNEISLLVQKI